MRRFVFVLLAVLVVATASALSQAEVPADVVSLLQNKCAVCHQGRTAPQGLSWEPAMIVQAVDRPSREAPSLKIIDRTAPEASYVLKKVRPDRDIKGKPMPPLQALGPAEIKLLEDWIRSLKQLPARIGDPRACSTAGGSER